MWDTSTHKSQGDANCFDSRQTKCCPELVPSWRGFLRSTAKLEISKHLKKGSESSSEKTKIWGLCLCLARLFECSDFLMAIFKKNTLPEIYIATENGWLEYYLFGGMTFGILVSGVVLEQHNKVTKQRRIWDLAAVFEAKNSSHCICQNKEVVYLIQVIVIDEILLELLHDIIFRPNHHFLRCFVAPQGDDMKNPPRSPKVQKKTWESLFDLCLKSWLIPFLVSRGQSYGYSMPDTIQTTSAAGQRQSMKPFPWVTWHCQRKRREPQEVITRIITRMVIL